MNIENAISCNDKVAFQNTEQGENEIPAIELSFPVAFSHLPPRLLVVGVQRGPLLLREHVRRQPRLIGVGSDPNGLRGGSRGRRSTEGW